MAEAEGGRARDRNGRDVIRYSAKIFIPPLGAPPLPPPPPPPTGRTIATTMSCSPGARSSGRRDGHDPREGGQGRTDGQARRERGRDEGRSASSIAFVFRGIKVSFLLHLGFCLWQLQRLFYMAPRLLEHAIHFQVFWNNLVSCRAPIREKGPVGIPVKLSPNIISYMPIIVDIAGIPTLEEKDRSIWSQIHSDKSCGQR